MTSSCVTLSCDLCDNGYPVRVTERFSARRAEAAQVIVGLSSAPANRRRTPPLRLSSHSFLHSTATATATAAGRVSGLAPLLLQRFLHAGRRARTAAATARLPPRRVQPRPARVDQRRSSGLRGRGKKNKMLLSKRFTSLLFLFSSLLLSSLLFVYEARLSIHSRPIGLRVLARLNCLFLATVQALVRANAAGKLGSLTKHYLLFHPHSVRLVSQLLWWVHRFEYRRVWQMQSPAERAPYDFVSTFTPALFHPGKSDMSICLSSISLSFCLSS